MLGILGKGEDIAARQDRKAYMQVVGVTEHVECRKQIICCGNC